MGTNISPQALAVEAAIDLAQILDWFERNDQTDAMEMVREFSPESFDQIQEDLANIAKVFNFTGPCAELQGGIKNIIATIDRNGAAAMSEESFRLLRGIVAGCSTQDALAGAALSTRGEWGADPFTAWVLQTCGRRLRQGR